MNTEVVLEMATLLLYSLIAAALTVAGAAAELLSVQNFGGGELSVAVWAGVLGFVLLYAGLYGIGYQKLLARVI
ncbi:hypothetical protein NGM29_07465 [Natronosalvus rutilus]|uniref:DUF8151 domain-containing protein n=1 Tax=Natronosalvus rutilus TaxID=2953753 RepID=A0A9E7SXV3_9EURY|nr:hypothetical protein NGM29_07465 [Natronosalvus rutilus]